MALMFSIYEQGYEMWRPLPHALPPLFPCGRYQYFGHLGTKAWLG